MARYPDAEWNPTGATPGGRIVPRVIVLHVIDGDGDARPHSGLEWHFEVFKDGRIQQQVDTTRRADANYRANPFAISIETEGTEFGFWTEAQIASIVKLCRWLLRVHPTIEPQLCDAWDGSGVGFHTMWGAPSEWTPVAKSCPGPNRKKQFPGVLEQILNEEDDMSAAEEKLDEILELVRPLPRITSANVVDDKPRHTRSTVEARMEAVYKNTLILANLDQVIERAIQRIDPDLPIGVKEIVKDAVEELLREGLDG